MCDGKTPFSRSLSRSTRPLFSIFSSRRSPFKPKFKKFTNFLFKMLKFGKFQFLTLKISQNPLQEVSLGPNISSERSIFVLKNQFSKLPILALIHSVSTYFETLQPHTPTLLKCKYPLWDYSTMYPLKQSLLMLKCTRNPYYATH